MPRPVVALTVVLLVASCASRDTTPGSPSQAPSATPSSSRHENLNALVWMQTALEYEATALQAYRLATLQLDVALKDPSWTAAIEQTGDASKLPPAVVLDVDETVLDNSYYAARTIRANATYSEETWSAWVHEARATPIPGALEFTRAAAKKGVTVFYVTNRMSTVEASTRKNLEAQGFPVSDTVDAVLTRGERPEWQPSGKGPRRAHVAKDYRILLLIGDDLGDFVVNASGTPEERRQRTAPNADWWGRRWIMLPNPTYGSWERAIVGTAKDPTAAKWRALRFDP